MAYDSTPYVGMAPQKMAATLEVHKWHVWNVCVRLINCLYAVCVQGRYVFFIAADTFNVINSELIGASQQPMNFEDIAEGYIYLDHW